MDKAASPTVYLPDRLVIGRDSGCDIVLDYPYVSRQHCLLKRTLHGFELTDTSSNGTFYKGQRLKGTQLLCEGDEFQVGLSRFVLSGGSLVHLKADRVRLDIVQMGQQVGSWATLLPGRSRGRMKTLLRDVSFKVRPGELVAIVGGSGAGKSTLLKALTGFRPAMTGHLYLNGVDLYANLDQFRTAIGYVPQDDIVHQELTVEAVLRYAARLRLPPDTDAAEIERRVDQVLTDMKLGHRKYARITTLSGGERKRVNVGVELVTRPPLIFLDEPTTGLSPDFEVEFVRLLRRLTEQGHTIVMVTHAERCIEACDRLVLLAQEGRLAFTGSPTEVLAYFGVSDFAQMLRRVNGSHNPVYWEEKFRASDLYRIHTPMRPDDAVARSPERAAQIAAALGTPSGVSRSWPQFRTLTRRYWDTLKSDPMNIAFLLAQAPVAALLFAAVFPRDTFVCEVRVGIEPGILKAPMLLFWLVLISILFGLTNAAREITKERSIFLRERMVNLRLAPYVLSKVVILAALCLVQSISLLFLLSLHTPFGLPPGSALALLLIVVLASICGMLLGLLVSAFAGSSDQAVSLIPLALLPQIVFSGGLSLTSSQEGVVTAISAYLPSHWAYRALGRLTDLNACFASNGRPINSMFQSTASGGIVLPEWVALLLFGTLYALGCGGLLLLKERSEPIFQRIVRGVAGKGGDR